MTLGSGTPGLSAGADLLGSGVPVFTASNISFVRTAVTLSENQQGKRKGKKKTGEPPE